MRQLRRHERLFIDEPITFAGRISFADSLRATLIVSRPLATKLGLLLGGGLGIAVIVSMLNRYVPVAMLLTLFGIATGLIAAIFAYAALATAAKTCRQLKDVTVTYGVSPRGVEAVQANASSHLDWSFFRGYHRSGNLALLAMPGDRVLVIPRAAVAPEHLAALDALLATHLTRLR